MGSYSNLAIVIAVVLAQFMAPSHAEISYTSISEDTRPLILFKKFGFSREGRIDITVRNISDSSSDDMDPSCMGFFLVTENNLAQILMEYSMRYESHAAQCVLEHILSQTLFNFAQVEKSTMMVNKSFPVLDANEYTLLFANCLPNVNVWMNVRIATYNLQSNGKRDYLSVGQTPLPIMYFVFLLVYVVLGCGWCYVCWKKKGTAYMIHILMGVLLIMKALNLLCQAEVESYTKRTGTAHGWDIALYGFTFVEDVMRFTVIVLIGTGWSIVKPFLQDRGMRVLMIVIPLQVFANIAAVVIDQTGPAKKDWFTWAQLFLLVDVICCCAVLFPAIGSIKNLLQAAQTNGEGARNLMKLTVFRQYFIVVVSYLFVTRIVVFALRITTSYKYSWACNLTTEVATLAFYIFTAYKFRPKSHNSYFRLDEEEEEALTEKVLAVADDELEQ